MWTFMPAVHPVFRIVSVFAEKNGSVVNSWSDATKRMVKVAREYIDVEPLC